MPPDRVCHAHWSRSVRFPRSVYDRLLFKAKSIEEAVQRGWWSRAWPAPGRIRRRKRCCRSLSPCQLGRALLACSTPPLEVAIAEAPSWHLPEADAAFLATSYKQLVGVTSPCISFAFRVRIDIAVISDVTGALPPVSTDVPFLQRGDCLDCNFVVAQLRQLFQCRVKDARAWEWVRKRRTCQPVPCTMAGRHAEPVDSLAIPAAYCDAAPISMNDDGRVTHAVAFACRRYSIFDSVENNLIICSSRDNESQICR